MPDASSQPPIPAQPLLTAISDPTRWRIMQALLDSEPLPASEIARRLGIPATNISKHCAYLCRAGILVRGFGDLYKIKPDLLVPGEPSIDLGQILLRLDLKKPSPPPAPPPAG